MHFKEVYKPDKYLAYSNATYFFQTTNDTHDSSDDEMTLYLNSAFYIKAIGGTKLTASIGRPS